MASRTPRQFSAQAQYSGRVLASGAVPTAYQTLQEGLRGLPPFGLSRVRMREYAHAGYLPGVTKSSW